MLSTRLMSMTACFLPDVSISLSVSRNAFAACSLSRSPCTAITVLPSFSLILHCIVAPPYYQNNSTLSPISLPFFDGDDAPTVASSFSFVHPPYPPLLKGGVGGFSLLV